MAESKKAKKAEAKKVTFAKATEADYAVIKTPVITEKSMGFIQNQNKVTFRVKENSNKIEIKEAFQRIYQVKVTDVKIVNVASKEKTRGSRYKGSVPGYKKAVITIAEGEAIDLFKE